MSLRPMPYIGVTGITGPWQAERLLNEFKQKRRLVMIGVLASSKTLRGEANKWPARYPAVSNIASLFPENNRALGLVHFHSDGSRSLASELREIAAIARKSLYFRGFQLNVKWPNPSELHTYHHASMFGHRPKSETIVLQCGAGAMREAGNDPVEIARRIAEYGEDIDYVLIDPSGGLGKEFDPIFVGECFEAILRRSKTVGVGVAGGLSAETIHLIEPLLKRRYKMSIDAEGRLRDRDDNLDMDATIRYLKAAEELFAKYP